MAKYEWKEMFANGSSSIQSSDIPFTDDIEFIKKIVLDCSPSNWFLTSDYVAKKYGVAIPTSLYRKAREELVKEGLLSIKNHQTEED